MDKKVKILKALANKKRLEILQLLKKQNLNSSEIAYQINLHFKSTSKHLQTLTNAGLIKSNRNGSWMIHNLQDEAQKILNIVKKIV